MKRRETIYNLGNDYFQKTDEYFVVDDKEAETSAGVAGYKAYSDGLYHFTTQPVYELSGGASALNKRIFNVLPQSAWTEADFVKDNPSAFSGVTDHSAVFSPDYATGIVVGVEDPKKDWKKPE
jgi:hypothetical protein